jgi:phosphatidylserine/phosphatidylglycerophosphate/cardiolipin synthase-like enzyme
VNVQVMQYGVGSRGVTDSTLHRALIAAGARGVKVRLIAADWALGGGNEAALRDLAAHANVEVKISRVPDWSGGYIPFGRVEHCKYMTVDGEWLWLGTSNWEPGYFLNTRNLGYTIRNAKLAAQGLRIFETSWNAPTAAVWKPDTKLPPRAHGADAPAGTVKVYGE